MIEPSANAVLTRFFRLRFDGYRIFFPATMTDAFLPIVQRPPPATSLLAVPATLLLAGSIGAPLRSPTPNRCWQNITCALLDSGGVHCWGDNFRGQLGNGMSGNGQESPEPVRVAGLNAAVHCRRYIAQLRCAAR